MTTATPRPRRSAAAAAVNGPWVLAYRPTRSPSGSATGSMNATGTPIGSGTPSASRRRLASSMPAIHRSPAQEASIARWAPTSSATSAAACVRRRRHLGDVEARRDLVDRERAEQAEEVGDALHARQPTVGGEALQLPLGRVHDVRVEQLAQLDAAEQLGQQGRVEGERLRLPLGKRAVALVEERADVAEQQAAGEGRRGRRLDLDDADRARLQPRRELLQRRAGRRRPAAPRGSSRR